VNHDVADKMMFWVGAMFAFTPIVVVGTVIATTVYLRKKRAKAGASQ